MLMSERIWFHNAPKSPNPTFCPPPESLCFLSMFPFVVKPDASTLCIVCSVVFQRERFRKMGLFPRWMFFFQIVIKTLSTCTFT